MSTPRFLKLPPGVRRRNVPTPHGSIAALEASPVTGPCERRPAVLVPGFTGSKEDFIGLLQTLAQSGRRVLAVDLPGQHQSIGPEDPDSYSVAALGVSVAHATSSWGDSAVHLLGHSFGGLVTRETVLSDAVPLLSYTVMSSGPIGIGGARAADAHQLIAALGEAPTSTIVAEVWRQHLDGPARSSGMPTEIYAFLRERMLANSPLGLARMAQEVTSAADRSTELAGVDLPMLVLYGEDDDGWPPEMQASMAKRIGADRVVIPGAAHSPNVEAPETTARALTEFWNEAELHRRDDRAPFARG